MLAALVLFFAVPIVACDPVKRVAWGHPDGKIDGCFYYLIPDNLSLDPANSVKTLHVEFERTPSLPITGDDFRSDLISFAGLPSGRYFVGAAVTAFGSVSPPVFAPIAVTYLGSSIGTLLDYSGWLHTGAGNSLIVEDSLFSITSTDGLETLTTTSELTNVHAHESRITSAPPFTFTGEFRKSHVRGSFGVTFLSQYTAADKYYRLRSYDGGQFKISPHGTTITGDFSSGVIPRSGDWYSFAIRVEVNDQEMRIKAKVWNSNDPEPLGWQIDCIDGKNTRLESGKFGVWAMGSGQKWFRSFRVVDESKPLDEIPPSAPERARFRKA